MRTSTLDPMRVACAAALAALAAAVPASASEVSVRRSLNPLYDVPPGFQLSYATEQDVVAGAMLELDAAPATLILTAGPFVRYPRHGRIALIGRAFGGVLAGGGGGGVGIGFIIGAGAGLDVRVSQRVGLRVMADAPYVLGLEPGGVRWSAGITYRYGEGR